MRWCSNLGRKWFSKSFPNLNTAFLYFIRFDFSRRILTKFWDKSFMCDVVVVVAVVHESFLRKHFLTIFWQVYRTKNEKCHSCKSGHSSNSKFFSLFNDTKLSPSGLSNSTTRSNFWKSIDVLSRINFTQKLPKTITWKLHNTSKQQDSFEHNF